MLIIRSPTYWIVTIAFLLPIAGCFAYEQTRVTNTLPIPSASAKVSLSSQVRSTSTQAPLSSQTVIGQNNCKNSQTQAEINTCAKSSAEVVDKKLNQLYQELIAQIEDLQQEKLLRDAQLAWIKFRDASCEFERSCFEGGSIAPSVYFNCIERVTKQRTEELEGYLKSR